MSSERPGCHNRPCWLRLGPDPVQHTNGKCNCLQGAPQPLRRAVMQRMQQDRAERDALREEVGRLREIVERFFTDCPIECVDARSHYEVRQVDMTWIADAKAARSRTP